MDSTTIDEFKISSLKSEIQDLYRQKGDILNKYKITRFYIS